MADEYDPLDEFTVKPRRGATVSPDQIQLPDAFRFTPSPADDPLAEFQPARRPIRRTSPGLPEGHTLIPHTLMTEGGIRAPTPTPEELAAQEAQQALEQQYQGMGGFRRGRAGIHNFMNSIPVVRHIPGVSSIAPQEDVDIATRARPWFSAGERVAGRGLPMLFAGGVPSAVAIGAGTEGGDALLGGQDPTRAAILAALGGATGGVSAVAGRYIGDFIARRLSAWMHAPNTPGNPLAGIPPASRQAVIDIIQRDPQLSAAIVQGRMTLNDGVTVAAAQVPGTQAGITSLGAGSRAANDAALRLADSISTTRLNRPFMTPASRDLLSPEDLPRIATGGDISSILLGNIVPPRLARWSQQRLIDREMQAMDRALATARGAQEIYGLAGNRGTQALQTLHGLGQTESQLSPAAQAMLRALLAGTTGEITGNTTPSSTLSGQ